MTRPVLIDEISTPKKATPYDTNEQAYGALRTRIHELFADRHSGYDASMLEDHFGITDLDEATNEQLDEFLCDLWVFRGEGSQGVWTNFSSADRWSVSGEFPEEKPFGNGDTMVYETVGQPSGKPIVGREATDEEDARD